MYAYPSNHQLSFHYIAKMHIEQLRKRGVDVVEIDNAVLRESITPPQNIKDAVVAVHPIFYTFTRYGDLDISRVELVRRWAKVLIGFEVADSDRISDKAVRVANMFDLIIVPSTFVKNVFCESGVKTNIEVVPHGIPDIYAKPTREPWTQFGNELLIKKRQNNHIYVLFFLTHSGFRKGADLVYDVMKIIQRKYQNVILVIKRAGLLDPLVGRLRQLRHIEIAQWLSPQELVDLYDVCDICLVFSRGGGFELNALEAIARGTPTLVPKAGPFLDYIDYVIPIEIEKTVKIFDRNPIHVGEGFEVCIRDAVSKLEDVIENLDEYKAKFWERHYEIVRKYSWDSVGIQLLNLLTTYGIL